MATPVMFPTPSASVTTPMIPAKMESETAYQAYSPSTPAPASRRDRSDTMMTSSSDTSSLSPTILTPPTPSTLGLLSQNYVTSPHAHDGLNGNDQDHENRGIGRYGEEEGSPEGGSEAEIRWDERKRFNYAFGKALNFPGTSTRTPRDDDDDDTEVGAEAGPSLLPPASSSSYILPEDHRRESVTREPSTSLPFPMSPDEEDEEENPEYTVEDRDILQVEQLLFSDRSAQPTPTALETSPIVPSEFPFPPMVLDRPTTGDNNDLLLYQPCRRAGPSNSSAQMQPDPASLKSTSSFRSAVRRKLSRSKSSLRSIASIGSSSTAPSIINRHETADEDIDGDSGSITSERPRKHRLRSLISLSSYSRSRTGSTSSLRSLVSTPGAVSSSLATRPPDSPSANAVGLPATTIPSPSVIARDFGTPSLATVSNPMEVEVLPNIAGTGSSNLFLSAHRQGKDQDKTKEKGKGKSRVLNAFRKRPPLLPSMSTGTAPYLTTTPVIAHTRLRAMSSPYAATPTFASFQNQQQQKQQKQREERRKVDLIGTMLPRELQLRVFKTLLRTWIDQGGDGRWHGEVGGRRELIKLTRVSKSWRSLCLDGQLWSLTDLTPFASRLHRSTFSQLISTISPFITTLSMRGLEAIHGHELVSAAIHLGGGLPSLRTLDLRGCKNISGDDICQIITAATDLKVLNLKGVQNVSSEVIRTLARSAHTLEELDVSRCWNISLSDLTVYIRQLTASQAQKITKLRIAGIKGYGQSAADFIPLVGERLVNLKVFDLLGCANIFDSDFARLSSYLTTHGKPLSWNHLILSNCVSLSVNTLASLVDMVPHLRCLELANVPDFLSIGHTLDFQAQTHGNTRRDSTTQSLTETFIKFLKSVPNLKRVDLEGTGVTTAFTDSVLDVLTPGKGVKGVVGSELTELRLGFARHITPRGVVRLIRGCDSLRVLEVNHTSADNAVMLEFHRRSHSSSSINLMDCRAITLSSYQTVSRSSRPRAGWVGWDASPFGFLPNEIEEQVVIQASGSWRRVAVPGNWRTMRLNAEDGTREGEEKGAGVGEHAGGRSAAAGGIGGRRGSWWGDDEFDDRGCVVM